jgi:hypothetical protein
MKQRLRYPIHMKIHPKDLNQLKEVLMFLVNELAATREMNVQLTNDISQLKTTVSRLQQDHHVMGAWGRFHASKILKPLPAVLVLSN